MSIAPTSGIGHEADVTWAPLEADTSSWPIPDVGAVQR
jgi:hypothetical protein